MVDKKNGNGSAQAEPVVTARISGEEPTTGSIDVKGETADQSFSVPAVVFSEEQAKLILSWAAE